MVGPRVSGGIFDNQALLGNLRFFQLAAPANYFDHTTSNGTTTLIPGGTGVSPVSGSPVPGSVADRVFRTIMENCTVVLISVIDGTNIHFICQGSGFGWDQPGGGDAAADMQTAIRALSTIGGGAIGSLDSPIPDATASGTSRDLSVGGVTLVEVDFDIVT